METVDWELDHLTSDITVSVFYCLCGTILGHRVCFYLSECKIAHLPGYTKIKDLENLYDFHFSVPGNKH